MFDYEGDQTKVSRRIAVVAVSPLRWGRSPPSSSNLDTANPSDGF
jgi:hypothetical protein